MAIAFRMTVFSVSFVVFSMFFMLYAKPVVCAVLFCSFFNHADYLIFFVYIPCNQHYCNTVYYCSLLNLFVINLSLSLAVQPHLGVLYVPGGTHTQ